MTSDTIDVAFAEPVGHHLAGSGFVVGIQGRSATTSHWYEFPSADSSVVEVWTYTDRISYAPGDEVRFHVYCNAPTYDIYVERDGSAQGSDHVALGLPGAMPPTPSDAYASGPQWPVAHRWRIPSEARSGPYVVTTVARNASGGTREQHHLFVVRPAPGNLNGRPLLMMFTTSTWVAYNEWGGANFYAGMTGPNRDRFSPRVSLQKPWARGQVRLPEGAPHATYEREVPRGWAVDIPFFNWAYATGHSKWYVGGSYAEYDSLFYRWVEEQGYDVDFITQQDLHEGTVRLGDYRALVIAGHDEYWSTEMRDAVDRYLDHGGHVARFGGNFFWQIRIEDDGATQVSYKMFAHEEDPVRHDPTNKHRLTTIWDDRVLNRPGALTLGLNGTRGLYARMGGMAPRHPGGFTVYRPDHWIFEGTDLYYGDVFGAEAGIFGFEVDGLHYTFHDGLPYPTGQDGAPVDKIDILAMAPAVLVEENHRNPQSNLAWLDEDALIVAQAICGNTSKAAVESIRYGAGMVVSYRRGDGVVLNAGSCMWSMGLKRRDVFTEQITHNILRKFSQR